MYITNNYMGSYPILELLRHASLVQLIKLVINRGAHLRLIDGLN